MKKVFVVLLSLFITVSFTAFGDEESSLSAGLEFGIADVSNDERMPYLMPMIIYEQSFLIGS